MNQIQISIVTSTTTSAQPAFRLCVGLMTISIPTLGIPSLKRDPATSLMLAGRLPMRPRALEVCHLPLLLFSSPHHDCAAC